MRLANQQNRVESSPESVRSNDPHDRGGHLTGDRTLLWLGQRHQHPDRVRCPFCFELLRRPLRPSRGSNEGKFRLRCRRCRLRLPEGAWRRVARAVLALPPGELVGDWKPKHPPGRCGGEGNCVHCVAIAHWRRMKRFGGNARKGV